MKILAFGAHPDDIEFGVAHLLLKEAHSGAEILLLICSEGESGSNGTAEIRAQESRKAAALIGAKIEFLDCGGDGHMNYTVEHRELFARKIREYQPDIVLAPTSCRNQHPDHYFVSDMVRDACRVARYGGYKELLDLPKHSIKNLFFYGITSRPSKLPDIVIDVTTYADTWKEVMLCHQSQMRTASYLEMLETRSKSLGNMIGVEYGAGLYLNDPLRLDSLSDLQLSGRNF
jgi:LmbE family N-acetylglucosaminyl deacetylase